MTDARDITCVHDVSVSAVCESCRIRHGGRTRNMGDFRNLPHTTFDSIPGAIEIQGSEDPEPFQVLWTPPDTKELEAQRAARDSDYAIGLSTLARLSMACMEQARWMADQGTRPQGRADHHVAAVKWAARGEELLSWAFPLGDDDEELVTPREVAWRLLGIEGRPEG